MTASEQIDAQIAALDGWRCATMTTLRAAINGSGAGLEESWKWDTPVWTKGGKNVVALGVFKDHVKVNFFKGAALDDPKGLFNAGLDAKASRGIDLREGDKVATAALKQLVKDAAAKA